ncbi:MAG: hypothetical protein QM704_23370 [Anaeromyxobacteraceae bacterium]
MPRHALLLAAALGLLACTPAAVIPDGERDRVAKVLDGATRHLRVAAYVSPFYGDAARALLSDQPPAELDLVRTPGGDAVKAPSPERVLAPGTAVRVREVQFPTGWTIAKRVVMSPRYHPWAILDLAGEPRPLVLVLSQTAVTYDDVRGELERVLAVDDPGVFYRQLPEEQRNAVFRKELLEGMSTRAVEMAWGLPERKKIDRPANTEEWTWPGGRRTAFFEEDRLVRWEKKRP